MPIPAITGIIRRRILLNYRIHADVVKAILPPVFAPKLHKGFAIAGICLIRLERIRPKGFPEVIGIASENSAHRIAVLREDDGKSSHEAVYITRRDTNSRLNSVAGGRLFPGVHSIANFETIDNSGIIAIKVTPKDGGAPLVDIEVEEFHRLPKDSIFDSLEEASNFFERGSKGYSPRADNCKFDGLELRVDGWKVAPLRVRRAASQWFDDATIFPPDKIRLDHALLMRDISHEWHGIPQITP